MAGTGIYGQILRAQLENAAADLTPTAIGLIYYHTGSNVVKWYTGAAWKTAVDTDSTQGVSGKTFTSCTLSGASNSLSNISLSSQVTGTLPIGNGGTGETTALAAFDALSPASSKGHLIVHDGVNNSSLSVGTNGQVLTADSTQATGVKWADGGAGSGSGEINVVTNPSAASATTGWTAGTSHTVARITSGSPLDPTVATALELSSSASVAESPTSGVYWSVATMPAVLLSKKLKVEFYVTVPASDVWRLSVYQGTTRLALSTDSSGATTLPAGFTGKFTAYFDTTTATAYSVNFTKTTHSGANNLKVTSVVVGPGIQPQGAVVSEWKSAAVAPTVSVGSGVIVSPTTTTRMRRIGDSLDYQVAIALTSNASNTFSDLYIGLPDGLTIDSTKLSTTSTNESGAVGRVYIERASAADKLGYAVLDVSNNRFRLFYEDDGTDGLTPGAITASLPVSTTSGANVVTYNVQLSNIPIAQWAGSGTVNVAQNDVEYASNSSSTDGDDTSSFVYGPAGSAGVMGVTNLSSNRRKRVRFQSPVQASDLLVLEIKGNSGWRPLVASDSSGMCPLQYQNGVGYGIALDQNSTSGTDVDVLFARYYYPSGATYGAAGAAWGSLSGYVWRVRKVSGGAAVGFGQATGTTLGLSSTYVPKVSTRANTVSSTNYTVTDADGYDTLLVSTGASQRTITLPTVASSAGRILHIKKTDAGAGTVLIDTPGAETIDGAATNVLTAQYAYVTLVCDGSNWHVVSVWDQIASSLGSGLSSSGVFNNASVSLTPGIWTADASFKFTSPDTTWTATVLEFGVSANSGSFDSTTTGAYWRTNLINYMQVQNQSIAFGAGTRRVSLTTATTYYLAWQVTYSAASGAGAGWVTTGVFTRVK